jgi:hypothetical protein
MIWIRRILTIPLLVILVVILFLAVSVTQANDTLATPTFYSDRLAEADMYNSIYDEILPSALDEASADESWDLPIYLSDIEDELVSAARDIFPPEWLQTQVESATNAMIPYLVGDTDTFSHTIWFKDRAEAAADVLTDEVIHSDAFTNIYDDLIAYAAEELYESLKAELSQTTNQSTNISQQDVDSSLRSTVTESWLASQLEAAVDSLITYMTGDSNHFTVSLPLQDVFTDEDLLELLGEGNEAYLDEARNWISDEWSFTDADLLANLDETEEETLQDVRGWIANGYTFTQTELREAISEDKQGLESFDRMRGLIHTGRTLLWLFWILPFLLIIGIGFLGGRSWKSRPTWALGALLLAAVIVFLATSLIYSNVAEPQIDELMADPWQHKGAARIMVEKGNQLLQNSFDSFVNGMKVKTAYIMIASGAILLGIATWYVVDMRRRPAQK